MFALSESGILSPRAGLPRFLTAGTSEEGGRSRSHRGQQSQRKAQASGSLASFRHGQALRRNRHRPTSWPRALLNAGHPNGVTFVFLCVETFPCDKPFNLPGAIAGGGGVGGYPHYTDKETEARSLINLLQVIQMAELEFEARPSCAQSPF